MQVGRVLFCRFILECLGSITKHMSPFFVRSIFTRIWSWLRPQFLIILLIKFLKEGILGAKKNRSLNNENVWNFLLILTNCGMVLSKEKREGKLFFLMLESNPFHKVESWNFKVGPKNYNLVKNFAALHLAFPLLIYDFQTTVSRYCQITGNCWIIS